MTGAQRVFALDDASQVGEVRRGVQSMAAEIGFGETAQGEAAIVATELARNIVKHAVRGELLIGARDGGAALEVLALDKGPGMADVERCLTDGYSTAGTPGNGLGAARRLSRRFSIYSRLGLGTAVVAELRRSREPAAPPTHAAVCVPFRGEAVAGDAWLVAARRNDGLLAVVADGLGHGPLAAEAADRAVEVAERLKDEAPAAILQRMHEALRPTRGAAVAVAAIDGGEVRYAGVGNISCCCVTASGSRYLVSHNGTLGHELRRAQEFTASFPGGSLLLMHSDGLTSHWRLDAYPGLVHQDPALLAGVLYRDHTRGRDDTTVLALRHG